MIFIFKRINHISLDKFLLLKEENFCKTHVQLLRLPFLDCPLSKHVQNQMMKDLRTAQILIFLAVLGKAHKALVLKLMMVLINQVVL